MHFRVQVSRVFNLPVQWKVNAWICTWSKNAYTCASFTSFQSFSAVNGERLDLHPEQECIYVCKYDEFSNFQRSERWTLGSAPGARMHIRVQVSRVFNLSAQWKVNAWICTWSKNAYTFASITSFQSSSAVKGERLDLHLEQECIYVCKYHEFSIFQRSERWTLGSAFGAIMHIRVQVSRVFNLSAQWKVNAWMCTWSKNAKNVCKFHECSIFQRSERWTLGSAPGARMHIRVQVSRVFNLTCASFQPSSAVKGERCKFHEICRWTLGARMHASFTSSASGSHEFSSFQSFSAVKGERLDLHLEQECIFVCKFHDFSIFQRSERWTLRSAPGARMHIRVQVSRVFNLPVQWKVNAWICTWSKNAYTCASFTSFQSFSAVKGERLDLHLEQECIYVCKFHEVSIFQRSERWTLGSAPGARMEHAYTCASFTSFQSSSAVKGERLDLHLEQECIFKFHEFSIFASITSYQSFSAVKGERLDLHLEQECIYVCKYHEFSIFQRSERWTLGSALGARMHIRVQVSRVFNLSAQWKVNALICTWSKNAYTCASFTSFQSFSAVKGERLDLHFEQECIFKYHEFSIFASITYSFQFFFQRSERWTLGSAPGARMHIRVQVSRVFNLPVQWKVNACICTWSKNAYTCASIPKFSICQRSGRWTLGSAPGASVHLSLRWKIDNSWNLHNSCTKCRSKRSPFTALKDWKLVILAHENAFLLQVQIQAFTFHCAERLKTRDTCTRIWILAPGADPIVHLSLHWKMENSWNLHTYMNSCSKCRSKRSPFTALKDWKLLKLAHVYEFLLQVQNQAFTFHCAGTRICILAPGADPSVHHSLRWKIEDSWNLHTYMHSCSKCRSKRSPFTALEDWNLVKLAHVYAFLLHVQIKRSPFTALEDWKTLDTCTRTCILAPGAVPSVHLSLRWKIEHSWNLHTFFAFLL